ncbi:uncharacterized protein LOC121629366 isoform X2 [Melanotaenia boesemani]|uniref:uncharacterized protein LOC121628417 isoform X2 n=1 Tax=Melanotaenia boesemani TaxID=1250792 RepID=UPI001C0570E5|nr:uncharacterized protein LOC121628417 isoform X2 [Melanotaenia boesemani]XP_041825024.1 uncharacterized protein LOC121629366 isoform X2 [Melanotaenia boesemani]
MAAGEKSVSELLREVAYRLDVNIRPLPHSEIGSQQQQRVFDDLVSGLSSHNSPASRLPNANASAGGHAPRTPVQEVARLFAPYRARPSSTPSSLASQSSKKACRVTYTHTFFCLCDHMSDTVPAKAVKYELTAAGLGEKRISFRARDDDPLIFKATIEDNYPQLNDTGGFELLRISGTTRSRNLCSIPCPDTGYTVRYLRSPLTGIGQAVIYIRPLQKSISLENSSCTLQQQGPLTKCLSCDTEIPLNKMKNHISKCTSSLNGAEPRLVTETQARQADNSTVGIEVPSCSSSNAWNLCSSAVEQDVVILASTTVSTRAEQSSHDMVEPQDAASRRDEEKSSVGETPEWKCEADGTRAAWLYKSKLLAQHETKKAVVLRMDLRESIMDQERSLISFYKEPKVEWASPVCCKLEGDAAVGEGVKRFFFSKTISLVQFGFHLNFGNTDITRLFDGEPDHLTPSTSQTLLESDMFLVAGRMMGHSFIHGGPCVSGMSPAIIHVLFGGSPETATIQIEDCPDIDIRSTIQLLDSSAELTEKEKSNVLELALSWDLPGVTQTNRRWLYERLLFHAVMTRTSRQVKQLRKGLKETMVWPLLTERADIIPLFLPRESETAPTGESILEKIVWPVMEDDEDEEECAVEDQCRVTGYLRSFIENASCEQHKALLKFWTGWEVLPTEMTVEVVNGKGLPKSSTCFEVLRLPAHYQNYESFCVDMQACLKSSDSGFGLV